MPVNIGPKIGIDGEAQFRKEIQAINKEMKQYAAETKAVTAAYAGQEDSIESLTAKSSSLSKQLSVQEKAVAKVEEILGKVRQQYGDNDEATQRWESELVKARAELTRLQNQLDDTKLSLEDVAEGFQQAGDRLSSAGNTLTVGLTAPLVAAGTAAVNYASDTEESLNKVQVAFGNSAASVEAWSETTLTSIGLARGTALDMAALYGDMATSMGFSQEAAADMSKELVNLAADLSSFKNVSIDEANTALKSIFTGEAESLKNLGVVMTETNLDAYALAKGFQKTYSEMSETEKVSLRYQYVMEKTANAQGDFSRTSDSTANQTRILKESLKEAAATLGEDLLPVVTPVISKISELVQEFAALDEETRKNLVQAGLFLATLGPMLKLTGGITTAVNAGITAYKSLQAAHTAATASQMGLNAAMASNPVGAVVTAVGSLVAVLGSLAAASALAGNGQKDLNKELAETEKTRQAAIESAQKEQTNTLGTLAALEDLVAVEDKTAAQKQSILSLVEDLNEAMPELNLAYDEQTDSLNMTAEAVRNLAEAEAQRAIQEANMDALVEQYQIKIEAEKQLADAETQLAQVRSDLATVTQQADEYIRQHGEGSMELQSQIQQLASEESYLTTEVTEAKQAVSSAEQSISELSAATVDYTDTTAEASEAVADQAEVTEEQTDAADELRDSSSALSQTVDTLTRALDEQADSGSISLGTALDLIDAGYAAALAIDTETGAITVNKDAYIALAQAKIDEQVAALEAARAAAVAAQANLTDSGYALANAEAYYKLAEAKAAAEDEVKSYDAQIAALKTLKNSLGSYTYAVQSSSGAGKKAATQAEKNLEKYQKIRDELDHMLAMGQVTEEAYYTRLAEIRDQYLTDADNIDEYRKITEEIYKYDQQLAEDEDKLWAEQTQAIVDELQNRLDEVVAARDNMAQTLSDYGDLFTVEDDVFQLGNLQQQIDTLNQYEEVLGRLRERGISDSLMSEVTDMEVDDAIKYGEQLLGMSDTQWEEYNQLWEEKQQRAIEIATEFYKGQLDTLKTEYDEKLGTALDGLTDTAYDSGIDTAQGLADGINANKQAAIDAARDLASQIAAAMNGALDINSPSGVTEQTGRYTAQGFEVGFVDEMRDVRDRMARSSSTADAANQAAAGVVNGLAGVLPAAQGGTYEIHVNIDGTTAATVLFDPLRGVIRQKGEGL